MDGLREIAWRVSSDAVGHLVFESTKDITVEQFLKQCKEQYKDESLITIGFILVDKNRKPITSMIHFGKGVVRPGVWKNEYYSKKVKKVYLTDTWANVEYRIEVAE